MPNHFKHWMRVGLLAPVISLAAGIALAQASSTSDERMMQGTGGSGMPNSDYSANAKVAGTPYQ